MKKQIKKKLSQCGYDDKTIDRILNRYDSK